MRRIVGLDGRLLDARFSVEVGDETSVVIESRGGTVQAGNARNLDYTEGFAALLTRLSGLEAKISDAVVDSAVTASLSMSREARRMTTEHAYPIDLRRVDDLEQLRVELCAAQRPVGRKPGAKGLGNSTKRVRLYVEQSRYGSCEELSDALSGWSSPIAKTEVLLGEVEKTAFDPADIEDTRHRQLTAIVQRQGQPEFREKLFEAYGGQCCISDCGVAPVLEAAHIVPYRGERTNHVTNGLLLRSDLHVLFDRGLLGVAPTNWLVVMSVEVRDTEYRMFHGKHLQLPARNENWPNEVALDQHLQEAGLG